MVDRADARAEEEIDHLTWFCESAVRCSTTPTFHCKDLGTELKPIIEKFFADEAMRTCKKCGTVMQPPAPAKAV